ncbi:MAG: ABC transporter permease [Ardenticatenaceae bacterium]|nr:ABC transporter permease [Ardenticatenaceae bacterium]
MLRLIGRRLLFITTVTLAIIFLIHLGMRLSRNSEIAQPEFDIALYSTLAWTDTRDYLGRALQGEFGTVRSSSGAAIPIRSILAEAYLNSMGLLLIALAAATLIGIPLGAAAALLKQSKSIPALMGITVLGISVPSFFAAILWRQAEIYYVYFFGHPLVSVVGFGWDYQHMTLPLLVLSARPLAYLTRAAFLGFKRTMEEDYIRTAYSKGLGQMGTVIRHALPNVAVPLLTAMGVSLRFALGALPIVEFFFLWPGLGLRLLEAIDARQTAVVVTLATALGLTFLTINFLLDIAYWVIDPRIREEN